VSVARLLGVAAAVATVSFAGAGAAAAADPVNPTVTNDGGTYTMVLHSKSTGEMFVPKGGAPTTEEPKGEPGPGDGFQFTEDLSQDGTLVGTDKGTCTITAKEAVTCKVAVTFPNGTLSVIGSVKFSEEGEASTFQVIGGTGAYAGAKGSASVKDESETESEITLRYTLGGGQVSQVPVGGAETGGGAPADSQSPWVLGLGAAATAAGAAMLAGSARRARRSS
jgi:hypothetical protein